MRNSDILRLITLARLADNSIRFLTDGSVSFLALNFQTALEAARFLIPVARQMKADAEYLAERRSERRAMGVY